jgi:NAD(P)-dependent dehydrogenase (short-subunit alcohol dehydrogenase family)
MRLTNKVALVTGSTKGIGRATAVRFAAEGASVVLCGRSEDLGGAAVDEITAAGGTATFIAADLTHEDQVERLVETAVDRFGRLDILVNNAAVVADVVSLDRPIAEQDTDNLDLILRLNVYGAFWSMKYAIPAITDCGGGSIVNISSYGSQYGIPRTPSYSASKGALNALTRQVAVDYAPNIRCNAVIVGMVVTEEILRIIELDESLSAQLEALTLTRPGTPADVAAAAAFLASDDAAFITGALVNVDGGMSAKSSVPDTSHL